MKEDEFYPTTVDYRAGYNWGSVRATTNMTWANENYLTYNTTLGEDHDISAMAGFSMQNWKLETTRITSYNVCYTKLLRVLLMLDCKYGRTIQEISERFVVSQRTVYRYFDTFKQA